MACISTFLEGVEDRAIAVKRTLADRVAMAEERVAELLKRVQDLENEREAQHIRLNRVETETGLLSEARNTERY